MMPPEGGSRKNSLSPRTLGQLHRYLDDFVQVGKARRGELSPVELELLLRKAFVDEEEMQRILSEYKRFCKR